MDFNPLDYPLAWTLPELLSEGSHWVAHIPFAFALLEMTEPRLFVELGTHRGDSYCAICQGVALRKLPTRCVAIDSWQGDPHAGIYGPEVLQQLRSYHDPRYAAFSTLMQRDFDSAALTFEDRSIDLLHIDGLHTYDAVRNDYDHWIGKMSDRGVILFHDVAIRDGTFGVWKLWEELQGRFPSFMFEHSAGLGVLVVGANPPERLGAFLRRANEQPAQVRGYFSTLGTGVQLLRMTRIYLGAMDFQRQEIDRWRVAQGMPPREGPMPSSAKFSAVKSLMADFNQMLRRAMQADMLPGESQRAGDREG